MAHICGPACPQHTLYAGLSTTMNNRQREHVIRNTLYDKGCVCLNLTIELPAEDDAQTAGVLNVRIRHDNPACPLIAGLTGTN
jgi:hypothetical protein